MFLSTSHRRRTVAGNELSEVGYAFESPEPQGLIAFGRRQIQANRPAGGPCSRITEGPKEIESSATRRVRDDRGPPEQSEAHVISTLAAWSAACDTQQLSGLVPSSI